MTCAFIFGLLVIIGFIALAVFFCRCCSKLNRKRRMRKNFKLESNPAYDFNFIKESDLKEMGLGDDQNLNIKFIDSTSPQSNSPLNNNRIYRRLQYDDDDEDGSTPSKNKKNKILIDTPESLERSALLNEHIEMDILNMNSKSQQKPAFSSSQSPGSSASSDDSILANKNNNNTPKNFPF